MCAQAGLASARSTERSAAFPIAGTGAQNQQQVVGVVSNMTWATTGSTSTGTGPHHSTPSSTLFMPYTWALYDFAEDVALDRSGHLFGRVGVHACVCVCVCVREGQGASGVGWEVWNRGSYENRVGVRPRVYMTWRGM